MTAKRCSKCEIVKPLSAFPLHPDGKYGHRAICKMCVADYMREYRAANKQSYQRERDGTKARNRALERLATENPERFAALVDEEREMVGLSPVGETPRGRRPMVGVPHGTTTMYRRGCRCQPCRSAITAYNRRYAAQKRAS